MRFGLTYLVSLLAVVSISVVQGFCPSHSSFSRVGIRRGIRPLAEAEGYDFEEVFDDEFNTVRDPLMKLNLRQKSLFRKLTAMTAMEELNAVRFQQEANDRAADRKEFITRFDGIDKRLDGIEKGQMRTAAFLAAWTMLAPKLFEMLLAVIPHSTM